MINFKYSNNQKEKTEDLKKNLFYANFGCFVQKFSNKFQNFYTF